MRYAFGLVSLLVVVGVVVMVWTKTQVPVIQAGRSAHSEAARIAGQDGEGVRAVDSIVLDATLVNGSLRSLRVGGLMPGGPMEAHFGLRPGDEIVAVIDRGVTQNVREHDEELAKALVVQAYQTRGRLVVLREGQQLVLPAGEGQ